jgi:hypothetical protein
LLRKFAHLHYEMEAMNEHRWDLERYFKLKILEAARKGQAPDAFMDMSQRMSIDSFLNVPPPPVQNVPPQPFQLQSTKPSLDLLRHWG